MKGDSVVCLVLEEFWNAKPSASTISSLGLNATALLFPFVRLGFAVGIVFRILF